MGSRIIREYSGISRSPLIMESSCPSFNSYSSSSTKLAEIASRVVRELGRVSLSGSLNEDELVLTEEIDFGDRNPESKEIAKGEDQNDDVNEEEEEEKEAEEFEFSFASVEPGVTTEEIFYDGKIRPLYYPLFDTTLLNNEPAEEEKTETAKRLPLGKLFLREEYLAETASSCSSSEADELEGVAAESYCVWNPKERKTTTSGMRRKSNSTGSVSKRWKLKNMLLSRSNSASENKNNNNINNENKNNDIDNAYRVVVFTSKNKKSGAKVEGKELGGGGGYGDVKRRSHLSYGQSLGWVNGFSRNLRPF